MHIKFYETYKMLYSPNSKDYDLIRFIIVLPTYYRYNECYTYHSILINSVRISMRIRMHH